MIEIIKDAGAPPPSTGRGVKKYPFQDMAVGDAFDVPRNGRRNGSSDAVQATVRESARSYAKRSASPVKFAVRLLDGNTVRCWRIA